MENYLMNERSASKGIRTAVLSLSVPSMKPYWMLVLSCFFLFQPPDIRAQFANGADVSWLPQMEAAGYVFKDHSGTKMNCLDILKEEGINAIRIRAWVNPKGGYCNTQYVTSLAHRADSMGFNVLIDFHCSDTWADPGHQTIPAAWANDSLPQLLTDLYNYIYGVMDTLKLNGIVPKWVQIGNETNNGMMWPLGNAQNHMDNFAKMIDTGYAAVKAVDSTTQVIVHLSNGNDDSMYRWMFDGLKSNGARWNIIGMSVYPFWANLPWAVDDSLALITMKDMISRYNTKVMVVEAGYLYNQPIDANHYLLDLIAKTKSVGGLGVFYWEPECYNWQGYQMGAWDPKTEEPTVAMDAFLGKDATPVKETKTIPGYGFFIYPNPFNPNATIEYQLPTRSNVSITIYNVLGQEVTRLVSGYENEGNHSLTWSANDAASGVYFCRLVASGVDPTGSGNYLAMKKIVLLK